ncbi:hypothetical protein ACWERW_18490 [Streptomyces sp. NPDC004012]
MDRSCGPRITGVRTHLIALVQVLGGIPLLLPFADLGAMLPQAHGFARAGGPPSGVGTGAGWSGGASSTPV